MKNIKRETKYDNKYDDIINLPHHVSPTRPQMPVCDRAAQFSPFAALTGHDAAIKEAARLTDERIELDGNSKSLLNEKLQTISERIENHPEIEVTYFIPDKKKIGGSYVTVHGNVKKIDEYERCIVFEDGTKIPIEEIIFVDMNES